MTEKPNSVCKLCRKEIVLDHELGWVLACFGEAICLPNLNGAKHEPVAEPAEPSASPLNNSNFNPNWEALKREAVLKAKLAEPTAEGRQKVVSRWPVSYVCEEGRHRDCVGKIGGADANHPLKWCGCSCHKQETAAPQPVAGEGPERCEEYYKTGKHSKDCQFHATPEGTPKLEEIKEILASWMSDGTLKFSEFPSSEKKDIESLIESLRPFITPACSPAQCPRCGNDPDFNLLQCGSCGVIRGWKQFFDVASPASTGERDADESYAECSDKAVKLLAIIENAVDYEEGCEAVFELRKLLPNLDRYVNDEVADQIEKVSTVEANGWISVASGNLPTPHVDVLLWDGKRRMVGHLDTNALGAIITRPLTAPGEDVEQWPAWEIGDQENYHQATHWQPLPPAPTSVPQAEPPKVKEQI